MCSATACLPRSCPHHASLLPRNHTLPSLSRASAALPATRFPCLFPNTGVHARPGSGGTCADLLPNCSRRRGCQCRLCRRGGGCVCVYLSSGFKGQCFNYAIPIAKSYPPMTSLPYLGLVVLPLRTPRGDCEKGFQLVRVSWLGFRGNCFLGSPTT